MATTWMMTDRVGVLVAALALLACGEAAAPPAAQAGEMTSLFAATPDRQWRLPERLREVSGLAATADGRLFAHDDEVAVVYELDVEDGRIRKAFAVGDPAVRGDFEGFALTPSGDFHLVTSTGRLLSFREGEDGENVDFDAVDTDLDDLCEIEGLAYAPSEESLILACKTIQARRMRDTMALHAWSLDTGEARPWLNVPEGPLAAAAGVRQLRPSGMEIDPATGRVVLVAATGRALLELDPEGRVLAARRLDRIHVQAEGVAITADGALVIADEGAGGRALLSRYPRAHD